MFTLDDGTVVQEDAAGNVTVLQSSAGQSYAPNRSILTDFAQTVFGSLGRAIETRLAPSSSAAPVSGSAAAAAGMSPMIMMGLVVGAGFLAYKLLK